MGRQASERLVIEEAKARLRGVAVQAAGPGTVMLLAAAFLVGYSPTVRRALFTGMRWLIRGQEAVERRLSKTPS